MCGDVPAKSMKETYGPDKTPHVRGCTTYTSPQAGRLSQNPACAGMYQLTQEYGGDVKSKTPHVRGCTEDPGNVDVLALPKPRMCGDVPGITAPLIWRITKTPHVRGCTVYHSHLLPSSSQNPACAGMYQDLGPDDPRGLSKPRMCGDVPGRGGR